MQGVSVKAFAKVNISLEVKGKQPDGYHEIETLFHGICLHDMVTLTKRAEGIDLACEGGSPGLPDGQGNLAWRAADLLRRAYPDKVGGVAIHLDKRIPMEAGLGGGSADAAAVLLGLDRLYGLDLNEGELKGIAPRLGSDVAFCLAPLAGVGRGRGEILEPIDSRLCLWIVLVKPPFGLSAGEVYSRWRPSGDKGEAGLATALLDGVRSNQPGVVMGAMFNDLEAPASALDQRLADYRDWIYEAAASLGHKAYRVMLCGSGSTIAVFYSDERLAAQLAERLREGPGSVAGSVGADRMIEHTGIEPGLAQILLARTLTRADMEGRIVTLL